MNNEITHSNPIGKLCHLLDFETTLLSGVQNTVYASLQSATAFAKAEDSPEGTRALNGRPGFVDEPQVRFVRKPHRYPQLPADRNPLV